MSENGGNICYLRRIRVRKYTNKDFKKYFKFDSNETDKPPRRVPTHLLGCRDFVHISEHPESRLPTVSRYQVLFIKILAVIIGVRREIYLLLSLCGLIIACQKS